MKFNVKPTYFTIKDLQLVIELDRLLEQELMQIQKDKEYQKAIETVKRLQNLVGKK